MKVEEIYDILKADNFNGECVLKTCLKGSLNEGEITSGIATGYYSSIQILDSGTIYPDYITITDKTFYGFLKDDRCFHGKKMIYSIPLKDIKSFGLSSGLDHGKYHRPIYFTINR